VLDLVPVILNLTISIIKLLFGIAGFLVRGLFGVIGYFISGPDIDMQPFSRSGFVVDGDTLGFGDKRVRLFGIDAPERGQSQGRYATRALKDLISGEALCVRPIERDRYGRIVARVYLEDGQDLAQVMVCEGWARAATRYTSAYARDMHDAQCASKGLWATAAGIPDPAAWRAAQ
jgi:endonuclease YncB( thermonuclease family)